MENKFAYGDTVYVQTRQGLWSKAVVEGEKFNGGNGGFYVVRYVSNGNDVIVESNRISKISK